MTSALVQCDGADVPRAFQTATWDVTESISYQGPKPSMNLRLENLSHALLARIDSRAADLVRIAAYVYAADQLVSRGGLKDVFGKQWQRHFAMAIPVSDPAFWNNETIRKQLVDVLGFASDDRWEFWFAKVRPDAEQLLLDLDQPKLIGNPDSVFLFSGGADSLCAVVEAVTKLNMHPVLVSHRSTSPIDSRQKNLIAHLRQDFPQWAFPHISVWVNRRDTEPSETTQRTRSFLFASLGAAVALQLGLRRVALADNGVVSLNLPINGELVGARASRSTHPKFLHLFNGLLSNTLLEPVVLVNPLWARTRTETLQQLADANVQHLLQETVSCAYWRGRSAATPHCGVCSQCVDRRFGAVAAGLEEHDISERYGTDIFTDAIREGKERTIAESYVRFATRVVDMSAEGLFFEFPQLSDCIVANDLRPSETAEELANLIKRHARNTLEVVHSQIRSHVPELVAGSLPPSCLVRLVASNEHLADAREKTIGRLVEGFARGLPPAFPPGHFPENEAAVQRACDSILSTLCEELYRELPLLPFASISTKPDFADFPKDGGTSLFVEIKYPATRARLNQIVTEITSRVLIYRRQQAYVLFVVYDPNRSITNDERFKADCGFADRVWVEIIR